MKLTADSVSREINETEFELLSKGMTDEEKREFKTDLILDGKYDPYKGRSVNKSGRHNDVPDEVMTDEEIIALAKGEYKNEPLNIKPFGADLPDEVMTDEEIIAMAKSRR